MAVRDAGIARVVVGMRDPNPLVAGKGLKILTDAGVAVDVFPDDSDIAACCWQLNEVFLKWIPHKQPFVVLKTAMSLDGKIATVTGESQWITGEAARARVHEWRDIYDGIMVGIGTVLHDDPALTTRLPAGRPGRNPIRIIVDSQARTPLTAQVVTDGAAPTIIAVTEEAPAERIAALEQSAQVEVLRCGSGPHIDVALLMQQLGEREICSIFVEGGGTLAYSFLAAGLVDKVEAFIAPLLIGGREALTPVEGAGSARLADAVRLHDVQYEQVGSDMLVTGYTRSAAERRKLSWS